MNLVEQQTVLRDLSDDMLQQAMQGGMAPPYLVLAEVNRRKDARERYVSQKAKYDADQATVAQATMEGLMKATAAAQQPSGPMGLEGAMGAQMPPGGLDAALGGGAPAMPTEGGLDAAAPMDAMPAYADGGMVSKYDEGGLLLPGGQWGGFPTPGAAPAAAPAAPPAKSFADFSFKYPAYKNPYSSLMDLYNSQLGDVEKQREQARAMALISAGTGMMQGGQNTLKNIGAAFGPAMQGYQTQIGSIDQAQRDMMREKATLQSQAASGEQQFNRDFEDSMKGRAQIAEQLGLQVGTPEYENYVVGNQLASTAKGEMKNVIDEMGNIKTALVRNNKFFDPGSGAEMPGVRLLDDVTKATKIAENKGQLTDERLFKSAALSLQADKRDYENNVEKIGRTKDFINENWYEVGDFKSLAELPSSPAKELAGMLKSIESGAVMKMLLSLREASAKLGQQGTGFGNLTETELLTLQKSIGDLSTANKPQTILDNLDIVQTQYAKMMAAAEQDFQFAYETLIKNAAETGDDSMIKKFLNDNNFTDFETPRGNRYLEPGGSSLLTPDLGLGAKDEYTQ
jgi:hypothetical protein